MNSLYNFLGRHVPDMPIPVANAFMAGGATMVCYGGYTWRKANGAKETCKAATYVIAGLASIALGAAFYATKVAKIGLCREYLSDGDQGSNNKYQYTGTFYSKLPAMKEGEHYTNLDARGSGVDFVCHATLTDTTGGPLLKEANMVDIQHELHYNGQIRDGFIPHLKGFYMHSGSFYDTTQASHLAVCGPWQCFINVIFANPKP